LTNRRVGLAPPNRSGPRRGSFLSPKARFTSLARGKPCDGQGFLSAPVRVVPTGLHVAMETRPLPIAWPLNEAVLDGIEVDVVYVLPIILSIANPVFPETPLPDSGLAFAMA
jgi:hypothetical protein